jgi:hypothetical protein
MRVLKLFSGLIVILLGLTGVLYGQYIEDCGLLGQGAEPGCVIFNSDNYGEYELVGDIGEFTEGDYVWIGGDIDSSCESTCMAACLTVDSIKNCCDCLPGDCNGDGVYNIFDVTCHIIYLYSGSSIPPQPYELCSGDGNGDCVLNIFDDTYLIAFLYLGGLPPVSCEDWVRNCGHPLR